MSRNLSANPVAMKRSLFAFQLLTLLAVLAVSVPLVLGFFNAWHPAFDSMAHFRWHLAVAMAAGAVMLLFSPFRMPALAALLLGGASITTTLENSPIPGLGRVHAAFAAKDDGLAVYRLLQLNLRYNNQDFGGVLSLIGRTQPDVVTLEEVSAPWRERLEPLLATYPHQVVCPESRAFGVAILSRRPFVQGGKSVCLERMAIATVDFGGSAADVVALHLDWPWPFGQRRHIASLGDQLSDLSETALVAGDFNATPWSKAVALVAEITGTLRIPTAGATWLHRRLPEWLYFAGLPIDHVLAKGGVLVHASRTLEPVGSDHLPILVEFSLRPTKPAEPTTATVSLAGKSDAI